MDEDRLELRYMDELFATEKMIGEVVAIIGLQFNYDKEYIEEYEVEWEKFPEPEIPEEKPKPAEGEEGEEEVPPAEEEEEKKVPAWKPEDYAWTITDRKPKNLPQLFLQSKGINAYKEFHTSEQYGANQYEATMKCLDEFCTKVCENQDQAERYLYTQVIFPE